MSSRKQSSSKRGMNQSSPDEKERSLAELMARAMVGPFLRHGILSSELSRLAAGQLAGHPDFHDFAMEIKSNAEGSSCDLIARATDVLVAQATSLDALFTELARRSAGMLGDHPEAANNYIRLALKAQSSCRATLETLAKLHQPREQTVRHVHVDRGAQAVIASHFHHHRGGEENERSKQPHAPEITEAPPCATLPRPDAEETQVPISGSEGPKALQNAWRAAKRGS